MQAVLQRTLQYSKGNCRIIQWEYPYNLTLIGIIIISEVSFVLIERVPLNVYCLQDNSRFI